ncbi:diaminopimelate epimerase [Chloroflexota bacterium]
MNFTKVQGAGNDFILVETSETSRNWSQLAVAMCDRHFGVGSDGLLLVSPSDKADFRMRMFNPDGSEAEACGNGLRCSAKYVLDRGLTGSEAKEISAETATGIMKIKFQKAGNRITSIHVGMGKPGFGADDIPVAIETGGESIVDIKPILDYPLIVDGSELLLSFVSMGNPHAVCFQQRPVADFPLSKIGPKVEQHNMFPSRVNFEVANVINRQEIEARVWERGAGETLACGSGACAVAVVAHLHDYINNGVDIKLPGGTLKVEWDGVGEVFLSGPTEIVFTGEWPD